MEGVGLLAALLVISSCTQWERVAFMKAEPRRATQTEVWTEWERKVVNGVFPLRRLIGSSNHSAVFLTEYKAGNLADAAIKFVPADTLQTEVQLVQWGAAATLSHPHLLRLLDVGRCRIGGRGYLFVVMEHAEQTLDQILPRRALSPEEAGELLLPTLDTLAFLHRNQLVHGQLKPSNFLVVNDQLKLASDTLRPMGNAPSAIVATTVYDPPELKDGVISAAGDIWGLGMTLVEALTQRAATRPDERIETLSFPASVPTLFADTVRRCLRPTPANRPTVPQLEAQFKPVPQVQVIPAPQSPAPEAPRKATPSRTSPQRQGWIPGILAVLVMSLAIWIGLRNLQQHPNIGPATPATSQAESQADSPGDSQADDAPGDVPTDTASVASPDAASTDTASATSRSAAPTDTTSVASRSAAPADTAAAASRVAAPTDTTSAASRIAAS